MDRKYTGSGIGVAILDTGIVSHIDFDRRILAFRDFVGQRLKPYDDNGHGTHVAGIIGGNGKMSHGKYCGVAPKCHMVCAKVLDQRGNGRMQDVLRALEWVRSVRKQYKIRIINISVGTVSSVSSTSEQLVEAVEKAWDDGLIVVTAAGNMGPAPYSITAPGISRKVITVGSSDLLDAKNGISGIGPTRDCICKPDLVMPGKNVISCSPYAPSGYVGKSGTSMSTPKVTGAIACMLEKDPYLTNVEIKMLLRTAARDLGLERNRQGWGELDIPYFLTL